MHRYYDERASEYEEAYLLGTGTASISDTDVFRREAVILAGVIDASRAGGSLISPVARDTGCRITHRAVRA